MDECTILLICDDELGALELRRAIGEVMTITPALSHVTPRRISISWRQAILSGAWSLDLDAARYDLCIVAVEGDGAETFLAANPVLCDASHALLVVLDHGPLFHPPAGHGPLRILTKPLTANTLLRAVERLLLSALSRQAAVPSPAEILPFVRARLHAGNPRIEPLLDADADGESAVVYPDVIEGFGLGINAQALLDWLVDAGAAERRVVHRLRACSSCAGTRIDYGEACIRCSSVDFAREPVIHHFACAAVEVASRFQRTDHLTCPKCNERLRQIGMDYEKPADHCHCRSCGLIAPAAKVVARCWSCRHTCAPEETIERLVYGYELSLTAEVTLNPQQPIDDLRHHQGLSPRALFLYEAEREFSRFRRHHQEFTILMARLHGTADGRRIDPVRTAQRMAHLEKALTGRLRNLDIACAWEEGTVALLLPATNAAGGSIVADRIEGTFTSAASELDNSITIVVATAHAGFTDVQAMLDACRDNLKSSDVNRIKAPAVTKTPLPLASSLTTSVISPTLESGEFLVVDEDSDFGDRALGNGVLSHGKSAHGKSSVVENAPVNDPLVNDPQVNDPLVNDQQVVGVGALASHDA